MKFATWRQDASNRARASLSVRVGAAMLILALAAGCHGQLAHKHDFFAPGSAAGTRNQVETQRVLAYYQALQAAQHGCPGVRPAGAIGDDASLDSAAAGGQPARQQPWAPSCAGAEASHAAHGAAANSYRRWVEDRVRPLPEPSQTASSIGNDS